MEPEKLMSDTEEKQSQLDELSDFLQHIDFLYLDILTGPEITIISYDKCREIAKDLIKAGWRKDVT